MLTNSVPFVEHGHFQFGEDLWTPCTIINFENNEYRIKTKLPGSNFEFESEATREEIWIDTQNDYMYGEVFLNNLWFPCRFKSIEPFDGHYSCVIIWSSLAAKCHLVGMDFVWTREKIRIGSELHYKFECSLQKKDFDLALEIVQKNTSIEIRNSKNNENETLFMLFMKYIQLFFDEDELDKFSALASELTTTEIDDVNAQIKNKSLLQYSIDLYNIQSEIFHELLYYDDLNINEKDNFGNNALLYACKKIEINTNCIEYLIKKNAHLNLYPEGMTPLMFAIQNNWKNIVFQILKIKHCDVNVQTEFTNALKLSIDNYNTHPEIFYALLNRKDLEIDQRDLFCTFGPNALHYACSKPNLNTKCIEDLIEAKCDVNVHAERMTPLMYAIQNNWKNLIFQLFELQTCGINLENLEGKTILMQALEMGNYEFALHILKNNLNCNIHHSVFDALNYCCQIGHLEMVSALLAHSKCNINHIGFCDMEVQNEKTFPSFPLGIATMKKDFELVKLLCENDANLNIFTKTHGNAFEMALHTDQFEIAEILINYGLNLDFVPKAHKTAFDFVLLLQQQVVMDFDKIDQYSEMLKKILLSNCTFDIIDDKHFLCSYLQDIQKDILQFHVAIKSLDIFPEFSQELEPFVYRQDIELVPYAVILKEQFGINFVKF